MNELVRGPMGAPAPRVSAAENEDYHLLNDSELTLLERPEQGVIGALGFTFLGSFLGSLQAAGAAFGALTWTGANVLAVVIAACSMVLAIACLIIFGIAKWRNKSLCQRIRARPKYSIAGSSAYEAHPTVEEPRTA
jgi:hypothetical protein